MPTRLVSLLALSVFAACGSPIVDTRGLAMESVFGQGSNGFVYHLANCTPANPVDQVVVFLPGTTQTPQAYRKYLRAVAGASGKCTISVPYENSIQIGQCCLPPGMAGDSAKDPACTTNVLVSKLTGVPAQHTCVKNGQTYTVTAETSVEGSIAIALSELGLTKFVTGQGVSAVVNWEKVIMAGHSQGGRISAYMAMAHRKLAGAALFAGNPGLALGPTKFEPWAYVPAKTPVDTIRTFFHQKDAGNERIEVFQLMGVPASNVRVTQNTSSECLANAHGCTIHDNITPAGPGDSPLFANDWIWTADPPHGTGPVVELDGGAADAGAVDGSTTSADAGLPQSDAGQVPTASPMGDGCALAGSDSGLWLVALLIWAWRRRYG